MRALDIIIKKREGFELLTEEINFIVKGFLEGKVLNEQMSAFLMAVYFKGMTDKELAIYTNTLAESGDAISFADIGGVVVDKHSTGGVGDKLTLTALPVAAACGVRIAKMSGRGLGHTGGTVDKLSAIPGFQMDLGLDAFKRQIKKIGFAIASSGKALAPADKAIYALRDITGTVESIPLISASVMSKKLAFGAQAFVFDVKVGSGAFMKTIADAKVLADNLFAIAKAHQKNIRVNITSMEVPLGYNIGNSLEVIEAIELLKGRGPKDLKDLTVLFAADMMELSDFPKEQCKDMANEAIESGAALEKLKELICCQGGNAAVLEDYTLMPQGNITEVIRAPKDGYITKMNTYEIGRGVMLLGAGRNNVNDEIDLGAGVKLSGKTGDYFYKNDTVMTLYSNSSEKLNAGYRVLSNAVEFGEHKVDTSPLVLESL